MWGASIFCDLLFFKLCLTNIRWNYYVAMGILFICLQDIYIFFEIMVELKGKVYI